MYIYMYKYEHHAKQSFDSKWFRYWILLNHGFYHWFISGTSGSCCMLTCWATTSTLDTSRSGHAQRFSVAWHAYAVAPRRGRGALLRIEIQWEDCRALHSAVSWTQLNSEKLRCWKIFADFEDLFQHFGCPHSPAFASSSPPLERARYLATSLLLADNNDMVRMIVNSVKTDMASGNEAGAVLQKKHVNNCFLRA